MKKEKEYVVNVGNIGNITCDTRKEAEQVYNKYVAMSKSGKGRAGNEHVSLMIDGEPVKEHFADKEEYAKGSTIDKSLPEKLYVGCHLGNTFEYLKENKAYIHGLSSSKNYDFIAYKNRINYNKSMDYYELEFDVKKMLNLGFKIQNLHELYPDVGFGKDSYNIIVPEKYIIKGTKDEKGYSIKSDLLKDVKEYITQVNVLLNNYSLVDIDWSDESTAESDYGQKEFIEKNGRPNIPVNYINKVNKGDKMSKVMTWGNQSYAKGTNVSKTNYISVEQLSDSEYKMINDMLKKYLNYSYQENDEWMIGIDKSSKASNVIDIESISEKDYQAIDKLFTEKIKGYKTKMNTDDYSWVIGYNRDEEYRTGGGLNKKYFIIEYSTTSKGEGKDEIEGTYWTEKKKGENIEEFVEKWQNEHGYTAINYWESSNKPSDEYRTGGVAGSKHVDVTRGKRLVHGYKAVKGAEKTTNYSKGKPGVKVTPGYRLPHGYETTEAAKNEKYDTGGNLEDKLQTNLAKKIYDNIYDFIEDANENSDLPGYGIVLANAPIFIQREGQIEFWQDIDLIQSECDCYFEISDYNDLVIKTDQYQGDEYRTGGGLNKKYFIIEYSTTSKGEGKDKIDGTYWTEKNNDENIEDFVEQWQNEHGYTAINYWESSNKPSDEYRTGGVAGSKHVDVTRGRRLIHGYKAVKGSDKNFNYSKGHKGVKVTPGYRLPHGYETTEAAYNEKYAKGSNIKNIEWSNDDNKKLGIWLLTSVDGNKILQNSKNGEELEKNVMAYYKKKGSVARMTWNEEEDEGLSWVTFNDLYNEVTTKYRTGGVAGSKHVDVVRGYRLVHGYKAVKGSDKQENYSKGKPKVKVDKGWRLPHGYEVVEAYYNDKYSRGGLFGSSAVVKDINDEFASDELKNELKSKMKKDDVVIAFAYTDYGGDFFDKVLIEYFEENYPDNIVVENTGWSGQNAFVFGTPAEEFVEATENYPLGFEDTESYYYEKQYEEEQEGFARFIEDDLRDYDFDTEEVMQELNEKFGGYWNVLTTGLDYSYSDMIDHLKEKGLIKEKAAKGKNVAKETLLDKIKSAGAISENQVNLIKNRMNRGPVDSETQEVIDYIELIGDEDVKLTPEQNEKGIKFLRNLYKSPTGKVRTNNPFGEREISALDSFTHFVIVGFKNIGNSYRDNYVPVYAVIGKKGTFEYYYDGDVNIVGAKGMSMYRTGGVAGSKHVDVAKGYRLPHGYQAVKGSDKNFDYSKGYPKVKVDKGWRLPKGYEVVEGAYNMKYDTGGNFDMFLEENEENENWYNDNWFYQQYKNNKFMFQVENEAGDFVLEPTEMTIDEIEDYIVTSLYIGERAIYSAHNSIEKLANGGFSEHWGDGAYGGKRIIKASQIHAKVIDGIRSDVSDYTKQLPVGYSSSSSSNITESQYHRAVNHFVYFCMNYPSNFMDSFTGSMKNHLQSKFSSIYDRVGAKAAMLTFYTELDSENQKALLSWAMNNYKGTKLAEGGMMDTEMLSSFDIMKKGKNVDTKGSYTILKANRAYCGVHDKTYSEAVETAKNHQCHDGLIVKGEMIWTNGRVKGIRLADGEEMMYGEYEREYFTEPQMKELKKLSKSK